jgi:pulcherriminic acid synthase
MGVTATQAHGGLVEAFDAVVDDRPDVDRHEVFRRLRAELPIFRSERLSAWVVSRYDEVFAVLSHPTRFEPLKEGPGAPIFGRSFLQMSGREHNKKAGIVAKRIRSPRAVKEQLEGLVDGIAQRQVDDLPLDEPVDLRARYAMWIPLLAITELMAVEEAARFRDWYRTIAAGGVSSVADPSLREKGFQALAEVRAFLAPIIAERRAEPGEDLISDLVTATYDGEPLSEEEIAATVVFLLTAGVETTERVLTSTFRRLALDPGEWSALRDRRDDPVALAAFSAEALRVHPPVNALTRLASEPAELAGRELAVGEKVVVLLASANRDEEHFADAQRFDRDRFAEKPDRQFTSAGEILPFGAGTHHCTGSRLAETELVHAFGKLATRVGALEPAAAELPRAEGFVLRSPPALPVVLRPA